MTSNRKAFTLIELLIALAILVFAFSIIWSTFTGVLDAWNRGRDLTDELHHGDFVMEQIVSALRSAAFFDSRPDKYGFRLNSRTAGRYPGDLISWVTSGSAFMPMDTPFARGIHRVVVTIEDNSEGDPAVAVRAYPFLADEDDEDGEPWFISTQVKGLDCRVYNSEDEVWEDEWEDTNSVPSLVQITLYMDPIEEFGQAVTLERAIRIPIGTDITNAVRTAEKLEEDQP
ncbi:MAG: prepilin-type N-terminal cleavage/methylation domain-containing protein [Verrucomicrobia bacterium]|nr:prepilin-type N-terminal cleavage/methylation domain-containing protein [Verrucomicrobiota bacterium]